MLEDLNLIIEKHHAIFLEGDSSTAFRVKDSFKEDNDIFFIEKSEINIEDANTIKENAYLKPSFGSFRIVLVSTNKLGREASQAMLKILEEPPKETKIIIVAPNSKIIIPTILSRMIRVKNSFVSVDEEVVKFIKKSKQDRLKEVENILKDENRNLIFFLDQLENFISANKLIENKEWRESVEDILKSKQALQISGTSKKQILEYLALTMPNFK